MAPKRRTLGINRHREIGGEEGNTGPPPQPIKRKFYTMVVYNFNDEIELKLQEQLGIICNKYLYGHEICPSSGRPHLQGFISLKKPMRITELKYIVCNPNFKPCVSNEEHNVRYCSKDCTGVIRFGFPRPIEIIENLYPWQAAIRDMCVLTKPDPRKVYWYWEPIGNIGKSDFIRYMIVKHDVLACSGGKYADIMNLIFKQDMDKTNTVFFDIPRANKGHISYSALESIKNGWISNTKYETGTKVFNKPHVIIFANFPPENPELLSADKWVITELGL
jgi:hypothetical protein